MRTAAAATKRKQRASARAAAAARLRTHVAAKKRKRASAGAAAAARLRTPATATKRTGTSTRQAAAPARELMSSLAPAAPSVRRDTLTNSLVEICHPESLPHTLVLGTHPSKGSLAMRALSARDVQRRGGAGPQNYGSVRNCFWNIAGSALGFRRDALPYYAQTRRFAEAGLILWDVVRTCSYKDDSSLDSKINLDSIKPNDIDGLLARHPTVKRIAFAKTAANFFCKEQCFRHLLRGGEAARDAWQAAGFERAPALVVRRGSVAARKDLFCKASYKAVAELGEDEIAAAQQDDDDGAAAGRTIELIVLPSTSPANAGNRPLKEKQWHQAVYLTGAAQPPPHYVCAACHATGEHWLADCTHRGGFDAWKLERRKTKAKDDKDEDGFRWYL